MVFPLTGRLFNSGSKCVMYFEHSVSFKLPAIISVPSTSVPVTSTIFNTTGDEASTAKLQTRPVKTTSDSVIPKSTTKGDMLACFI